jgi:hypothetical protein
MDLPQVKALSALGLLHSQDPNKYANYKLSLKHEASSITIPGRSQPPYFIKPQSLF